MKNKIIISNKKCIVLFSIIVVFIILCFTEFYGNLWQLITGRGFFIPDESNIFIFRVTKHNEGSGEWWLYGEDNKYFYGLNTDENNGNKYYKIVKENDIINFNRFDYKTWFNK